VPLVVLTHFHADHVDGLPGCYDGREVGEVDVTGWPTRPAGVAVQRIAGGRRPVPAPYGVTRRSVT
jgi:competence protein ComEC